MEIDLQQPLPAATLPEGYAWDAWNPALMKAHAEVKFHCFFDQIDSIVFPSLGSRSGCFLLMQEIARRPGFKPEATWLINGPDGPCGTVQGIRDHRGVGAIQNLGVTTPHRGRGLGQALLLQALAGFQKAGLHHALLEVTAQNDGAIRLYRRLGFRCRKTIYKAVGPEAAIIADLDEQPLWLDQAANI
jgi:ribosomal protein S18 acetylase RimI-like enzyme